MMIVSACETETPDNPFDPEKEETVKLKKILVKNWGYIEFNYSGNLVSEMTCAFTEHENPEYAVLGFRYKNDELYEVIKKVYPDSINSLPRATLLYTFDFSNSELKLTVDYDTGTPQTDDETSWNLDAEGNLIRQERNTGWAGKRFFEWKDGNLIQSQTFTSDQKDKLARMISYQYDPDKNVSLLFTKEFMLAMCWIDYDFFFDYFNEAVLSLNNCTYQEEERFYSETSILVQTNYSYTYNENDFPETIQLNYKLSDDPKASYSSFFELEYE